MPRRKPRPGQMPLDIEDGPTAPGDGPDFRDIQVQISGPVNCYPPLPDDDPDSFENSGSLDNDETSRFATEPDDDDVDGLSAWVDEPSGEQLRDAGMALVQEYRSTDVERVQEIILAILAERGEVCADDVRERIDWDVPPPAVGTAFMILSKRGEITRSRNTTSKRPNQHAANIWYWRAVEGDIRGHGVEYVRLRESNETRLALAMFMAGYGNCAIPGMFMDLAHKPEPEPGMTVSDACEAMMFKAWLRGAKALGITVNPDRKDTA